MEFTRSDLLLAVLICLNLVSLICIGATISGLNKAFRNFEQLAESIHAALRNQVTRNHQEVTAELFQIRQQISRLEQHQDNGRHSLDTNDNPFEEGGSRVELQVIDPGYDEFYLKLRKVVEPMQRAEFQSWLLKRYRLSAHDQWIANAMEVWSRDGIEQCMVLIRTRDFSRT